VNVLTAVLVTPVIVIVKSLLGVKPPNDDPRILIVSLTAYPDPVAFLTTVYPVPTRVISKVALDPVPIMLVPLTPVYVEPVAFQRIPEASLFQYVAYGGLGLVVAVTLWPVVVLVRANTVPPAVVDTVKCVLSTIVYIIGCRIA
jgi:hypothetical protein